MYKLSLAIVTLLIILVGIFVFLNLSQTGQNNLQNSQSDESSQQSEPPANEDPFLGSIEDWDNFEGGAINNSLRLTLKVPQEVEVTNPRNNIYSFKYIGPGNEPATEITNGFLVSVTVATGTSLSSYIDAEDVAGEVESVRYLGYDARRYITLSQLASQEVTHYAFALPDSSTVIDVSQTYYGNRVDTYRDLVQRMLGTLAFESFSEESSSDDSDLISITSPQVDQTVSSPISLAGQARGQWFFEADAPVEVVDSGGDIIGEGYISASGNWMTTEFIPFTGEVTYTESVVEPGSLGVVRFLRANPSGLPENSLKIAIPITFGES